MLQETSTLDRYLEEVTRLYDDQSALLQLIEQHIASSGQAGPEHDFYRGELAFYQGRYKVALKHYLQAKELPAFHFFCHRACAFLCEEQGQSGKGLAFAQKAHAQNPNDPALNELLPALQESSDDDDDVVYNDDDLSMVSLQSEEFDELHQIFSEPPSSPQYSAPAAPAPVATTAAVPRSQAPLPATGSTSLDARIEGHHQEQRQTLIEYLNQYNGDSNIFERRLLVLHGWHRSGALDARDSASSQRVWSAEAHTTSGGYFLRWNHQGIAVNPGRNFLEAFHQHGGHIRDINHVIVTRSDLPSWADVEAIYDLNARVNGVHNDVHVINYYVNQGAYQQLAPALKPHYKQERHTVHCLELYLDSPEAEAISLSDSITLNYFPVTSQAHAETSGRGVEALGLRLDLQGTEGTTKIGYSSGAAWSPILADNLSGTDVLLAAFEGTSTEDYSKVRYNYDSLGYFGTLSLLEEVTPKIALCSEFAGRQGDIRLEVVQKLRSELASPEGNTTPTVVLPSDIGLEISLNDLKVRCSTSNAFTRASELVVTRSHPYIKSLLFLDRNDLT